MFGSGRPAPPPPRSDSDVDGVRGRRGRGPREALARRASAAPASAGPASAGPASPVRVRIADSNSFLPSGVPATPGLGPGVSLRTLRRGRSFDPAKHYRRARRAPSSCDPSKRCESRGRRDSQRSPPLSRGSTLSTLALIHPCSGPGVQVARALRIFRVFGTSPSLRRIINPLVASIIPVTNAFVILFVVIGFGPPSARTARSPRGPTVFEMEMEIEIEMDRKGGLYSIHRLRSESSASVRVRAARTASGEPTPRPAGV